MGSPKRPSRPSVILQDLGMDSEPTQEWLPPSLETALRSALPNAMPPEAVALYARWWQLETWLRDLAYVELRAAMGSEWRSAAAAATGRLNQDAAYTHMASADSDNPLAYLDFSQLADLIASH